MKIIAKLRYLRIAPRKVRLVTDLVRGKKIEEAKTILNFATKRGSLPVLKLLNQAIANAKNNFQLDQANLFISEIKVDEGPKLKRWRARARGQAYEIQKKTSHVFLALDEIVKEKRKRKKVKEAAVSKTTTEAETEAQAKKTELSSSSSMKEETEKKEKPKFKPGIEIKKQRIGKGITKIFRRKAF